MAKKASFLPFADFEKDKLVRTPSKEDRTPLIYYGGKSRDADWIIEHFPPGWTTLVDVFGGGGAITFRVGMYRKTIIYNDIGNVCNFMRVMRDHGEELYRQLYYTPYAREEFMRCKAPNGWPVAMARFKESEAITEGSGLVYNHHLACEWARQWYVTINQGYTHEETSDSWHKAIVVNSGSALANHTDDLPKFIDRLRRIHVENMDFADVIREYDKPTTLFYCDPPYLHETRADTSNYLHELPVERHKELLNQLNTVQGQVVLSGYDSELYNSLTMGWRTVRKTAKSSIQNRNSLDGRADRTEVLWIRGHRHGLWGYA